MTCQNCGVGTAIFGDTWCAKCIHDYDYDESSTTGTPIGVAWAPSMTGKTSTFE